MINFFRKIRKQLADQNKPLKYFRYALGEIVLVMIGILLALQVNTWNEVRKDQQELRNILLSIASDMKEDALIVKEIMGYAKEDNERIKSFLSQEDYSGFTRDSLEQSLQVYSYYAHWRMSGFDLLKDSGITQYGEHAKVVKRIKSYYDHWIPLIKALEDDYEDSVVKSDDFWRFEENTYEFIYAEGLGSIQKDEAAMAVLETLAKSPIPRKILKTNYRLNEDLLGAYENYLVGIDGTVKEIEDAILKAD
ncbi:DUF6090 family protein [Robiginitalea aurantiaca]|uniref:DUF6090 family protein n=1 Tax=Robiginitalea aurantiaca TaxID=3056915 RepID=A0ABT7WBM2_9FLAO|nr:DUF6090 family protein [Robiginitalea aurantiaca]MDM9630307.1 DUF6090 family protein [Robiginitalea aurantiaca]